MQYQSNMPLVNPLDPQAPLPALGTNPNPLSLAGVPIPSFQEMLNGPDAEQDAQQLSEYMRKRFAAQTAMHENLPQGLIPQLMPITYLFLDLQAYLRSPRQRRVLQQQELVRKDPPTRWAEQFLIRYSDVLFLLWRSLNGLVPGPGRTKSLTT
ncbi:unnamed protein product [Cylicocyclus nassatus]|uniref:Uncharacterized protein n=1 Tax=Cylicocyclus nassatus TaxID=53992 RepID=A0AA36DSP7_CYLNA|nr:unnamed protein product [Cylicocyclus nassatus]